MKKNQIAELISCLLIFILGCALMLFPGLGFDDMNYLFFIVMTFYGLLSYALYMVVRRKDDYEYLFIALASVIAASAGVTFQHETPQMVLSLSLIGWISMVAIIKLIKMDYYHDRNNILWFVRTITFVLFLIIGTLTCVNLYYNIEIQSLMLGFFLMVTAILESFDPIVAYLLSKRIRKVKKLEPVMVKENGVKEIKEETIIKIEKEVKKPSKPKSSPAKTKTSTKKAPAKTAKKAPAKKTTTKK